MENKSQIKKNKFLTVTVLTLFLLSATAISSASAQLDSTRIPDQTPTDYNGLISENPTLYTAQDNSTAATDDNSPLGRAQDNSTASGEDSTLYDHSSNADNPNLVATQAQSDDLTCIIVLVAGVAAIAGLAIFVSRRQTKNSKQ
jgi:hypothetical protein